jgi:hypothetical protein
MAIITSAQGLRVNSQRQGYCTTRPACGGMIQIIDSDSSVGITDWHGLRDYTEPEGALIDDLLKAVAEVFMHIEAAPQHFAGDVPLLQLFCHVFFSSCPCHRMRAHRYSYAQVSPSLAVDTDAPLASMSSCNPYIIYGPFQRHLGALKRCERS